MNRVLIASANEKAVTLIAPLMRESYPECRLSVCGSAGEARRLCGESDYDLVIINTPLPDERGGELAKDICDSTTAGCLVMTKAENAETLSEQLEEYGALVVARPISRVLFYQSVKMINASRKRIMGYAKENIKLHKKLDMVSPMIENDFIYACIYNNDKSTDLSSYLDYFNLSDNPWVFCCFEFPNINSENQYSTYLKIHELLNTEHRCLVSSFMMNRIAVFFPMETFSGITESSPIVTSPNE